MSRRILGVDPGLTRCGVGIIDVDSARAMSLAFVDVLFTEKDSPLEQRLLSIDKQLNEVIQSYRPDAIAIERVFSQHNVRTVMGTGQAAGIALLLAAKESIPVFMHTPSEVKAAVTGSGRADKAQVATMVKNILHLDAIPKPVDATDALALAICHAWRGSGDSRVAAAYLKEKKRIARLRTP